MDFKEHNINLLVEYFNSGCKKEKLLGLELEHFIVDKNTKQSATYELVKKVLEELYPGYGRPVYLDGHLIGIVEEGGDITLEPAAQIEISMGPYGCIRGIKAAYDKFLQAITPILDKKGAELACCGYHPKSAIDELPMIPKKRYDLMYEHFKSVGTRGKYMMKGSAATQVSIDYEDEADFIKKFRAANILGPVLALISDNADLFEGRAYEKNLLRTYIWNDVDPARSMVVKGALDADFGFREYAEYIYKLPPIFLPDGDELIYTGQKPSAEIFKEREMTQAEIRHVTSIVFPDSRLKTNLELRTADSMPIDYALSFTAMLKGIFYNTANLESCYNAVKHIKNKDVTEAKAALIDKGREAVIYGRPVMEIIEEVYNLAKSGLSSDETLFLKPLSELLIGEAK